MKFIEQMKLARKHSAYVRSLEPWEKKDLENHDKVCGGC